MHTFQAQRTLTHYGALAAELEEKLQRRNNIQPSKINLSPRMMKAAPALAEPDIFRTIQALPGVLTTFTTPSHKTSSQEGHRNVVRQHTIRAHCFDISTGGGGDRFAVM